MTTLNAGEGKVLDADNLAEIIAINMDMFYVAGSPPAGAKRAAHAILTALRAPSEEMVEAMKRSVTSYPDKRALAAMFTAAIDSLSPKDPNQ